MATQLPSGNQSILVSLVMIENRCYLTCPAALHSLTNNNRRVSGGITAPGHLLVRQNYLGGMYSMVESSGIQTQINKYMRFL